MKLRTVARNLVLFLKENMENLRSVRTRTRRKKVIVDFIDGPSDSEHQDVATKNITSRKRKKTQNPAIARFVVPDIVDQIVDLEEFLDAQEQLNLNQQNNSSTSLTAPPTLDVVFEFIGNDVNESETHQNGQLLDQESVSNPARQDAVFEFQGDDVVSAPPKKRAKILNPTPFYDAVNTASQGN